jgi:hypothetical protein
MMEGERLTKRSGSSDLQETEVEKGRGKSTLSSSPWRCPLI